MLHEEQKLELQKILNQELCEVEQSVVELKKLLEPVPPDNAIGRLSRMDALEMQSVNSTKLRNQQLRAGQLQMALTRIVDNKEYGICLECDEMIVIERLKARPEARLCVSCQQSLDSRST